MESKFDESIVLKFKDLEKLFAVLKITSGKSRLDRLDIPARALLRLRCAFGANARAEVLLELLTRGVQIAEGSTALALSEVGYSKRNIAFVLDDLVLAGILTSTKEGNRIRFRVAEPAVLERLLRPLPATPGRWHMRLPVIASFVELSERLRGRDAIVQGIEARKLLLRMMPRIPVARASYAMPTTTAETYWDALQQWLIDNLITDESEARHQIPRMVEGVWIGPNESVKIHRPERFTSAVLPQMSADPTNDSELQCLDLVQVPTVDPPNDWAWGVLSTAATTTWSHTIGLNSHEPWKFATWAMGERRIYSATYDDPLPYDAIARLYGMIAASRARSDRPAVQLRLKLAKAD